jgi:hypothetical protein
MTLNTNVWFGFAPSPVTALEIVRLQVLTVMVNVASLETLSYVPLCVGETVHVTV